MASPNLNKDLTAIIAKNDKLLSELETLRMLNEKEMSMYRLIESSPYQYFSLQKAYYVEKNMLKTSTSDTIKEAVEKVQINAALIIQRTYRNYLMKQRIRQKAMEWSVVNARKSIELIDKISKTINKKPVPTKFDIKLWKNEYMHFDKSRQKRAEAFERRTALLRNVKNEQAFLLSNDKEGFTTLHKQLKPYLMIKAEEELKWRLECAEDEAFISAL